jgi:hypothetical protein
MAQTTPDASFGPVLVVTGLLSLHHVVIACIVSACKSG